MRGAESPGFFCLTESSVPAATIGALRGACAAREVQFLPMDAGEVRSWNVGPLPPGAILYTPAVSRRALALEERLWGPGVATVYAGSLGPLRQVHASTAVFLHAGLPIPRAIVANNARPDHLEAIVAALGGLPVVVRLEGYSGGRGILRADSIAALASLLDNLAARGVRPEVVEFVPDAESWRVAVVGGRAVGATRGVIAAGDFRSAESSDPSDYLAAVPEDMAALAVAATAATEALAAGVDLLRRPDGQLVVLEANTPFYFGHLQRHGIDVAGALVDTLLGATAGAASGSSRGGAAP